MKIKLSIYENGKYTSIYETSPGGVKEYYKSNIDILEIIYVFLTIFLYLLKCPQILIL